MKKVIWIDVGTHFAQEYQSAFGPHRTFIWILLRRLVGSKIFLRGKAPKLELIKDLVMMRGRFSNHKDRFTFYFIEANSKIVNNNVYKNADAVFNIALTSDAAEVTEITKLYLANSDEMSQGSSIYLSKKNVAANNFLLCLGVQPSQFFTALSEHLSKIDSEYDVLLRLNCEGTEDEVIYAAHRVFGSKLKLVCGSLKDVEGVKGRAAYDKLKRFMNQKDLSFVFFSSDLFSWHKAHLTILDLLD